MSNFKAFEKITDNEITRKGVQGLADRPNSMSRYGQGGLTPDQLKKWFDQLATLVASKYNAMADQFGTSSAFKYIKTPMRFETDGVNTPYPEYETLYDLWQAIYSGKLAESALRVKVGTRTRSLEEILTQLNANSADSSIAVKKLGTSKVGNSLTILAYLINGGVQTYTVDVTPAKGSVKSEQLDDDLLKLIQAGGGGGGVAGLTVDCEIDPSTYVMTVAIKDATGNVLSSDTVDLPLETMVVGGDEEGGIVTLTLQNGNTISFDISDLVDGLVSQAKHDEDIAALSTRIDELAEGGVSSAVLTEIDALIGEGV